MKKVLLIPLLILALTLTACGGNKQPDTPTDPDVSATVSGVEEGDATTTTTAQGDKGTTTTTKQGDKAEPTDNSVDWADLFGGDDTTAATDKDGSTKKTTTTTTKKTTTATTTTMKPTTINKVELPAVGTDVDGRGRIKVSAVSLNSGVMGITIRNYTDEQKTQWITEETNYVTYACYDKDGKALTGKDENYGYLYLGCLEDGQDVSFSVELPAGTASVVLTGAKIVYWIPWS